MKAFAWIPFGLIAGFLVGFGVPLTADVLPLFAVASLVLGFYLLTNAGLIEG
jgi:hypothetical protein